MRMHLLLILLVVGTALARTRIRRQSPSSIDVADDPLKIISYFLEPFLEIIREVTITISWIFNLAYQFVLNVLSQPVRIQINMIIGVLTYIISLVERLFSSL